jgi:hypothetical protein
MRKQLQKFFDCHNARVQGIVEGKNKIRKYSAGFTAVNSVDKISHKAAAKIKENIISKLCL